MKINVYDLAHITPKHSVFSMEQIHHQPFQYLIPGEHSDQGSKDSNNSNGSKTSKTTRYTLGKHLILLFSSIFQHVQNVCSSVYLTSPFMLLQKKLSRWKTQKISVMSWRCAVGITSTIWVSAFYFLWEANYIQSISSKYWNPLSQDKGMYWRVDYGKSCHP